MANKGSGKHYTSKGERRSSMPNPNKDPGMRLWYQLQAFRKGKKTMVTIPNPNPNETNKRFIRVDGKQYFKPPKIEHDPTRTSKGVSE
jgi:hypothetical protein